MTYKDEFVELLDNLHDSDMMANNKRRHSMYCNYVCIKYGVLGVGVRNKSRFVAQNWYTYIFHHSMVTRVFRGLEIIIFKM